MLQLFRESNFDFIGKRRWAYLLSLAFIAAGLVSIAFAGGLRYGIDFSGGTLIQARFDQTVAVDRIRAALDQIKLGESVIQEFGDPREFIFRLPLAEVPAEEVTRRVQEALAKDPALGKVEIRRVEFVGPQVGRDLQIQALYAVLASMVGILIYVAVRFDLKGGVASIAAVVHDVLVCLGAMSLTGREMSLPVLAALTTFMATAILFAFGGKVLEDLAFVLTVGVVTGTYSTIYIAGALIVDWTAWVEARARRGKKAVAKAGSA